MNIESFVKDAIRTESVIPNDKAFDQQLFMAVAKNFIASAELLDTIKKSLFYNKKYPKEKIEELCNSSLNCSQEVADALSIALSSDEDNLSLLYASGGEAPLNNANMRVIHGILGYCTESSEMLESLVNYYTAEDKAVYDLVNLKEELGDVDWYKAILLDELKISESDIRQKVINKLRERYGEKFTEEAAVNRNLEVERKILEQE